MIIYKVSLFFFKYFFFRLQLKITKTYLSLFNRILALLNSCKTPDRNPENIPAAEVLFL